MAEMLIHASVEIIAALLITLIGALGTYLTVRIGKCEQLKAVGAAQQEVIRLAKLTVGELQQTVVDDLKRASADGRLTREEIAMLGDALVQKTREKMSAPASALLEAAAVDAVALIRGAGEDWVNRLKNGAQ